MGRYTFLFAALLSIGCGRNNVFYVDETFTADEWEDIRRAGTDWQIATKERFDFELGPVYGDMGSSRNEIIKAQTKSFIVWREGAHVDGARAFCDHKGPADSRIVLIMDVIAIDGGEEDTELFRKIFRRVVRHEMGHHLGIPDHSPVSGSVMAPGLIGEAPECIDSASVDMYCRNNDDCDRSQMRGCPIP